MKKLISVLAILVLLVTGCSKAKDDPKPDMAFTEYLDALLVDSVDPTSLTINLSFNDPTKFGINPENYELGFSTKEDYEAWSNTSREIVSELKAYTDQMLTESQIMDRDAMIDFYEKQIGLEAYYDYVNGETLGSSRSFNVQLPSYLDIYEFRSREDFDRYFHFIETLPTYYKQAAEFEVERQGRNTGYGQEQITALVDASIETRNAALRDDYFLNASFNKRVDAVSFLNDSEKAELKAKHVTAMKTSFAEAHENIVEALATVKAEPITGLANKPGGKAYYEVIFRDNTGSSMSISNLKKLITKRKNVILFKLVTYLQTSGNEDKETQLRDGTLIAKRYASVQEVISDINSLMGSDFPSVPLPNYDVRSVDESMESTSSPAFYFTPQVDYTSDNLQYIYVNGGFVNKNYTTYAHEGYPGHMYQFNYFLNTDSHPIRNYLTSSSNAEGWANYVENYATKYVMSEGDSVFYDQYQEFMSYAEIELDIGINYDGWSKQQTLDYLIENNWMQPTATVEDVADLYLHFVENPAVSPTYYVSSIYIRVLKEAAQKQWGSDYTDYKFHEEFLKSGSTSFDVIEKHMKLSLQD